MKVTIFLPISRDYIDRVFARLELLECDSSYTNLLVMVDGNDQDLFLKARNLTEKSKFNERLCIQYKSDRVPQNIPERRQRIADIKNKSREYIGDCDYIFGIEDDTLVPPDALKKLIQGINNHPNAGIIEGVELGRWQIPYVGGWKFDSVYTPTNIQSVMPGDSEEIDAGGFYCYITSRNNYINHDYKPYSTILGPDVNYGISLRQKGLKNYIDWTVDCIHLDKNGNELSLVNKRPIQVEFNKMKEEWRQTIV